MWELVPCQPHDNPGNGLGKDTDVLHAAAAFLSPSSPVLSHSQPGLPLGNPPSRRNAKQ